ncbi:MAG: hypothetical protein AABN33_28765 [Acidobacteriota bacterium]
MDNQASFFQTGEASHLFAFLHLALPCIGKGDEMATAKKGTKKGTSSGGGRKGGAKKGGSKKR